MYFNFFKARERRVSSPFFFFIVLIIFGFLFLIPNISAKQIGSVDSLNGFIIEPVFKDVIRQNQPHEFEVHVFNVSNGVPITSGITCYMHLYGERGNHLYIGEDATVAHLFDYAFDLSAGNFTELGIYQAKFQCNDSSLGGAVEMDFHVTETGFEGVNIFWILIIIILFAYGIVIYGEARGEFPPIIMGGLFLMILSLYIWINGFGNLEESNLISQMIAGINFVIGASLILKTLWELK